MLLLATQRIVHALLTVVGSIMKSHSGLKFVYISILCGSSPSCSEREKGGKPEHTAFQRGNDRDVMELVRDDVLDHVHLTTVVWIGGSNIENEEL